MSRVAEMLADRVAELAEVRCRPVIRIPFTDGDLDVIHQAANCREIYVPSITQLEAWSMIIGLAADLQDARKELEKLYDSSSIF